MRYINDAGEVVQATYSRVVWDQEPSALWNKSLKHQRQATDSATFIMPARGH